MANLNFNRVILGGRLTADPELKQTPSGLAVCSFHLAINRRASGEGDKKADFIPCVAWRNTAEFVSKYFRKGESMLVVGQMQVREYTNRNGQKRYATEVLVDEANFVDSRGEATSANPEASTERRGDMGAEPEAKNIAPAFTELSAEDDLPF